MTDNILAFSGGLDSTFALFDLYQRGETVTTCHLSHYYIQEQFSTKERSALRVASDRVAAELSAARKIIAWFEEQGINIPLKIMTIDWHGQRLQRTTTNSLIINCLVIQASEAQADHIIFGTNAGETWEVSSYQDLVFKSKTGTLSPQIQLYGRELTRQEQINRLPKDLVDLTMSCRHPKLINGIWTPCGSEKRWGTNELPDHIYTNKCKCHMLRQLLERYRDGWSK